MPHLRLVTGGAVGDPSNALSTHHGTEVQPLLELPLRLLRSRHITLPGLFYCVSALQYSWPPFYAQNAIFILYI